MSDWHKKVYSKTYQDLKFDTVEWRMLRDYILHRDKMTCLRCDKKFSAKKLSVHHLVPRSEGGSDDGTNLVTLCNKCHDIVEIDGYRTATEIVASYDGWIQILPPKPINENGETFERPAWHAWVYGGKMNPN